MGITDIVYQEINRYRDEKKSEEDRKKIAHRLVKMAYDRFKYDWKSYKGSGMKPYFANGDEMLRFYADVFLDIAAQVNDTVSEENINKLRTLATDMRKIANMDKEMGAKNLSQKYNEGVDDICDKCSLI